MGFFIQFIVKCKNVHYARHSNRFTFTLETPVLTLLRAGRLIHINVPYYCSHWSFPHSCRGFKNRNENREKHRPQYKVSFLGNVIYILWTRFFTDSVTQSTQLLSWTFPSRPLAERPLPGRQPPCSRSPARAGRRRGGVSSVLPCGSRCISTISRLFISA